MNPIKAGLKCRAEEIDYLGKQLVQFSLPYIMILYITYTYFLLRFFIYT